MLSVEMNPVRFDEVAELAITMREADVLEVKRSSGLDPEDSLQQALTLSDWVKSGRVDGSLVCIYGVAAVDRSCGIGSPWMLGTDLVEKYAVTLLRQSKEVINEMHRDYPVLTNFVDADNAVAIRWLEWLGFDMGEPQIMGAANHPFIQFKRTRYV